MHEIVRSGNGAVELLTLKIPFVYGEMAWILPWLLELRVIIIQVIRAILSDVYSPKNILF